MSRCERTFFLPGTDERDRCEEETTHYCSNCDMELCYFHADECKDLFCQAKLGLRPEEVTDGQ